MNKKRYVDYNYYSEQKDIVSIDSSEYIDLILELASKGRHIQELSKALVAFDSEIKLTQANDFINELIDSQILVSELEPNLTGNDYFDHMIEVLTNLHDSQEYLSAFIQMKKSINELDSKIGNDISMYENIKILIRKLIVEFNPQAIFQTDMATNFKSITISQKKAKEIKKGLEFLNRVSQKIGDLNLEKFKEKVVDRYGINEEIPISIVLDNELGIGYSDNNDFGDINTIVDDLKGLSKNEGVNGNNIYWNEVHTILQRKREEGNYTINLKDEDFKNLKTKGNNLCETISGFAELVIVDGKEMIVFNQTGGSTAGLLLGRFCHVDSKIHDFTLEIMNHEKNQTSNNELLAEIIHLPLARLGNVLRRPRLRNFEIPYLGKSSGAIENQIRVRDLTILINEKNELFLKYQNKIVLPRLCTAHIHNDDKALPVYRFLCALQYVNNKKGVEISYGPLENQTIFLPRLKYGDIIFSVARWNLTNKDIKKLKQKNDDDNELLINTKIFRDRYRIPALITVNELLINLNNLDSIRLFLDIVRTKSKFQIAEFLCNYNNGKGNEFANELIVSFFRS